jgi:hypothetical protein
MDNNGVLFFTVTLGRRRNLYGSVESDHGLIQLHRIVGPSVQAAFTAALIDGILLKCRDVYCLVLVASVALTTIFSAFCIVSSE